MIIKKRVTVKIEIDKDAPNICSDMTVGHCKFNPVDTNFEGEKGVKMSKKKKLPLLAQYWIEEGQRTGRFSNNGEVIEKGRLCTKCKRKNYSYPYSCNDGWPFSCPGGMTTLEWFQKAKRCRNYEE